MKRIALLTVIALAAGAALAADRQLELTDTVKALNGSPNYLGTVAVFDAGTANTWNTPLPDGGIITPFDGGSGALLLVQCSTAAYVKPGSSATTFVSPLNSLKLDTDEKFYLLLKNSQNSVAVTPAATAQTACKLFRVE